MHVFTHSKKDLKIIYIAVTQRLKTGVLETDQDALCLHLLFLCGTSF